MGSSSSRPRPRPADQPAAPYEAYAGGPPPGPQFLSDPRSSPYYPNYQNNGHFYGGFPRDQNDQAGQNCRYGPGSPAPQPSGADKQLNQTATIRNAVNVKKGTIEVSPAAADPSKLLLTFQFDASAPCSVTAFVAATEDPAEECRITPSIQAPAPGVLYEKGLGLVFQKTSSVDLARAAVVDLARHDEEDLVGLKETVRGQQYPIIIRLETVTEAGLSEGHSLSELTPGGPQKPWIQSQTTFAKLAKDDEGGFKVRTLKQKIWVDGVSYELQEIYGIEHATAAAKEREGVVTGVVADQEEERNCVICMVNARDTTVLPCRHMCMCHECAQELRKQTSKCPICRNHVESLLHIRMARQQLQAPKNPATPLDQSTVSAALDRLGLKSSSDKSPKSPTIEKFVTTSSEKGR